MTEQDIWADYQDEDQGNEYIERYEALFLADLQAVGASENEAEMVLDMMWSTLTGYDHAGEALSDLRTQLRNIEWGEF